MSVKSDVLQVEHVVMIRVSQKLEFSIVANSKEPHNLLENPILSKDSLPLVSNWPPLLS